ncbi:MAG: transglutaminase family protein [Opitutales bacterium]|nr:transglutaminase family protein [Opitutales bacterium]
MRFEIRHTTRYTYDYPASESVCELRLRIPDLPSQSVGKRTLRIDPPVPVLAFDDFFGNRVEGFSVYFKHGRLSVESVTRVETRVVPVSRAQLEATVGETRQIANSRTRPLFPFLQPSYYVPFAPSLWEPARRFFRSSEEIGAAALKLNKWIYRNFRYDPAATEISTPVDQVFAERAGVCQDFAHIMLALCRMNRVAARYVSGYIEPGDPDTGQLVGAAATHAWVEVWLPGGTWWGLDPTNNQVAGDRHVVLAVGRDYADVAPVRGRFKGGAVRQTMDVAVRVKRLRASGVRPSA